MPRLSKALLLFLSCSIIFSTLASDAPGQRRRRRQARRAKGAVVKTLNEVRKGQWGGPHIGLVIGDGGATLESDCAHGVIDEPLKADAQGNFDVRGTWSPEGGPVSVPVNSDAAESGLPARYRGRVAGTSMTLTVTLTRTGVEFEPFSLAYGRTPQLTKCY